MAPAVVAHPGARTTKEVFVIDRSVEQKLVGVGGDPFVAAAPALAEMTPSAREKLLREHYGRECREEVRRLASLGHLDDLDEDEGER
jgi:hypothetical protein